MILWLTHQRFCSLSIDWGPTPYTHLYGTSFANYPPIKHPELGRGAGQWAGRAVSLLPVSRCPQTPAALLPFSTAPTVLLSGWCAPWWDHCKSPGFILFHICINCKFTYLKIHEEREGHLVWPADSKQWAEQLRGCKPARGVRCSSASSPRSRAGGGRLSKPWAWRCQWGKLGWVEGGGQAHRDPHRGHSSAWEAKSY